MQNYDLSKVKLDPSGNVIVKDGSSINPQFLSPEGYAEALKFAGSGTATPPGGTSTATTSAVPSPYAGMFGGNTAPGTGIDPGSFTALLGQVGKNLEYNNTLTTQRQLLVKHLFDSPLTPDELAKLPQDVQNVINSGDRNAIELQIRILNDQIQGRGQTLDKSIQYLTQGYKDAEDAKKNAYATVLNYAKALNAKPSDVIKALYPSLMGNISQEQMAALDSLSKPLLTSTQIPNYSSSLSDAIVAQESGGDYTKVNPDSGALGKYQIMPMHLPDIGLDPNNPNDVQRFLSDPTLQDTLYQKIISDLQTKYAGDTDKVLAAYYGGDAAAQIVGTSAGDVPQGNYPSINDYVAQVKSRMQVSDAEINAQSLIDGTTPPSMISAYRGDRTRALAEAKRLDPTFSAAKAELDYQAAKKWTASMNSTQMIRFQGLAGSVVNTIDEVRSLAKDMKLSGIPVKNQAELVAYIQLEGNSDKGKKASQYLAAVNTLKEEFANLANGGYAPTDAAWTLANSQINANYGLDQLNASLTEVQRLINYRLSAIGSTAPVSPGSNTFGASTGAGTDANNPLGLSL